MKQKVKIHNKALSIVLAFLVSALVGSVGAVMWGLLYYNNVFAAFVSFLTAFAMIATFNVFWKNKVANYIWTFVFILISSILACYLALLIAVMNTFNVSFSLAAQAFSSVFGQIKGEVFADLALCVVFDVLGVVACIFTDRRNSKLAKQKQEQQIGPVTIAGILDAHIQTEETKVEVQPAAEQIQEATKEQKEEIKSLEDKIHGKK